MNLNNSTYIYGNRSNGRQHGDVFTSPVIVRFMLDKVNYVSNIDLRNIRILEPSCGEGEFVVEIANRLIQSANLFNFDANEAFRRNVRAYDIDEIKLQRCRNRLIKLGINPSTENTQLSDFLQCKVEKTDIVIGNPPYIRYENIPKQMLEFCRKNYTSFHYRCDLYVPFFEKTLSLLEKGGQHCFICSNRWLKNEYGKKLRKIIAKKYALKTIINLEEADAFQEEVLAYPAITIITAESPSDSFEYGNVKRVATLDDIIFSKRQCPADDDWTKAFSPFRSNNSFSTIEQQGFKIGIGAATGADAVFVSCNLPQEVEAELILPGINARDLRGNRIHWQGEYILNPYNSDGSLVDLADYPLANAYLEKHRNKLSARHIARKSPSRWYKTIDRINPSLLTQPKILLPDMSGNTFVFVDDGDFYPLHNIYYITGKSSIQLRLLAAFLMSDVVRGQLSAVTNAMNGGFSRWQSQHLRKLQLPKLNEIDSNDIQNLLADYESRNISNINIIVNKIYSATCTV